MSTSQAFPADTPAIERKPTLDLARHFYTGAAALLLVLMVLGFQQFYLHGRAYPGRPLTPPIRTLVILHGIAMALWMVLFLVQPWLIAVRNRRAHMLLGKLGAALAVVMVILGFRLGVESARVNPPDMHLWGLTPKQFMAVPVISILTFAVLVAVGVWKRRRPAIHRPVMLLSVLAVMPAALDRIDAIKSLYEGTVWGTLFGPFFSTLVVGVLLVGAKWLLTRSLDRYFAIGFAALTAISIGIVQLAPTRAWDSIAGFLLR